MVLAVLAVNPMMPRVTFSLQAKDSTPSPPPNFAGACFSPARNDKQGRDPFLHPYGTSDRPVTSCIHPK